MAEEEKVIRIHTRLRFNVPEEQGYAEFYREEYWKEKEAKLKEKRELDEAEFAREILKRGIDAMRGVVPGRKVLSPAEEELRARIVACLEDPSPARVKAALALADKFPEEAEGFERAKKYIEEKYPNVRRALGELCLIGVKLKLFV